jgi:glycosyltransferase involved in cell wall biosynthesis
VAWLPWPRQREFAHIGFVGSLLKRIRAWKPDVVHILNESHLWLNVIAAGLNPTPVITTVHDIQTHPGDTQSARVPRFLAHILVRQSRAIVVHGEALRTQALATFRVAADKVFVIPHPPLTYYSRLAASAGIAKSSDGIFRVLFFGRVHQYKGLIHLLEAAPIVHAKAPHVVFTIAGKGDDLSAHVTPEQSEYIRLVQRFVPHEEAARLFAEADLLVLPYTEASQSGVLMIGAAFGMPVVATDVGEIQSVVRSTGMGLIVPAGDAPALADAIVRVALDGKLQSELAAASTTAGRERYSPKQISRQMGEVYRRVSALQ